MTIIKIRHKTSKAIQDFNVELDKLIYVLSKLENNDKLKFESQEQIEVLMKKYKLFDEYFLANINNL